MDFTPCPRALELEAMATRFWAKVDLLTENGCYQWLAGANRGGYGVFLQRKPRRRGDTQLAHRVAWMLVYGAFPPGESIDHLCRNRRCENPSHMEPVSLAENARRAQKESTLGRKKWAAARTHCKNGHPYNEDNLYHRIDPNGRSIRKCRVCHRQSPSVLARKKSRPDFVHQDHKD